MAKYKIKTENLVLNGVELEKDSIMEIPWQTGDVYAARGWAEPMGDGENHAEGERTDNT
ncbi:MAG TPA: hypothetical protein VHP38_17080 [Ruminiclostridium sp.]|nr:hypothetical protein [Ruminiclostridium sp.]